MKIRLLLVMFLALLIPGEAFSQDAIFSQFFASSLYLNPAFAGTNESSRLIMSFRNHPFPDTRGFSTLYGSFDMYVPTVSGGLALLTTTDNQGGLLARSQVAGIYSYHLQVMDDLFVNFGVQAGYFRQDIRWDRLEFTNPSQEPPDNTLKHTADFAFGAMVFTDRVYGGVALHHITRPQISLFSEERIPLKYTAHLGFMIEPPEKRRAQTVAYEYILSPNLIYQKQGHNHRINLGFYGGIEPLIAGVWYRHNIANPNAVIFLLGFSANNFHVGYSYDHSLSGYTDLFHAAHEISISFYFLSAGQKQRQNVLKCPLY
jgi:type IX secretion system PorP/SprF family membrane protein